MVVFRRHSVRIRSETSRRSRDVGHVVSYSQSSQQILELKYLETTVQIVEQVIKYLSPSSLTLTITYTTTRMHPSRSRHPRLIRLDEIVRPMPVVVQNESARALDRAQQRSIRREQIFLDQSRSNVGDSEKSLSELSHLRNYRAVSWRRGAERRRGKADEYFGFYIVIK